MIFWLFKLFVEQIPGYIWRINFHYEHLLTIVFMNFHNFINYFILITKLVERDFFWSIRSLGIKWIYHLALLVQNYCFILPVRLFGFLTCLLLGELKVVKWDSLYCVLEHLTTTKNAETGSASIYVEDSGTIHLLLVNLMVVYSPGQNKLSSRDELHAKLRRASVKCKIWLARLLLG